MKDIDSNNYFHQFDKLIISYLIRKTCDDFNFYILCPVGLKELIKHDNLHNTDLLTTLKVYLANDRKQKKSADLLFIHRSSLLSRIDKIIEITNCDFEETDQKFLYYVLIRYYQKLQKDKKIDNK